MLIKNIKKILFVKWQKENNMIGTITEDCYKAMLNYQVEITD